MATVRLDRVRKSYLDKGREQVVVHDIDLAVNDGEFLVLVGPSGCGKSTTLRMIAGLESISAGTIRIGDRVVNDVPARDRDIAMVFQNYALYPHMSVAENLGFALKLRGMPAGEIATRVGRAAELLELTELLDRRPKQLSGGQRQRVAVGRAIVRSPQVFLFDEPLSNLDAKLRVQMRRQIAALRRTLGTTTIYVTHDQIEAMTLGDRIVVMKEGRIQQVDDPIRIYQRPANTFVASFVGSPPMNLIRGTVDEAEGRPVFQSAASAFRLPLLTGERLPEPGRDVILGVRPEGWRPEASGSAMTGVVDEVEPLGSESFVLVKAGGALLTVRLEGSRPVRRGDRVSLSPAASEIHWFDGPTEVRIGV